MIRISRRFRKDERGAAMVEFAIILPLLLLLVFGIIEFGLLFYDKAVVTNASREGARRGAMWGPDRPTADEIRTRVKQYCNDHLITFAADSRIDDDDIRINIVPMANAEEANPAESNYDPATFSSGDLLNVYVDFEYTFLVFPNVIEIFKNSTFTRIINLNAKSTMRAE